MNEEELRRALIDGCAIVLVNDPLWELIRELQENLHEYQPLKEYCIRSPEEIKKQIKYERNPMRLKRLNRELNDSYKMLRK